MGARYDYIVVGSGAAGCVVANRLSADPAVRVLLLEAGGSDSSPLVRLPVGFTKLDRDRVYWGYRTAPQRELNNRRLYFPQARIVGGGTSINGMLYVRGNRLDFDEWRDLGACGWGYADVLPYFRRAETHSRFVDDFHGAHGPIGVTGQTQHNALTDAFVRAGQELGLAYNHDFNGAGQAGIGYYDVTQRNVERDSAANAYLRPIEGRANLTVLTDACVSKVRVEAGRAVGIDFTRGGHTETADADAEVILCAGAINTPRLLLVSGIGPADELRAVGVPVVHDLPGVGKNLQDHLDVYVTAATTPVSYNGEDRWHRAAWNLLQYLLFRTGPATTCVAEAGAFVTATQGARSPDLQLHCLPAFVIDHGERRIKGHGITINTCNLRPRSIGEVTIASADPLAEPVIDPNFLAEPADWRMAVEGFTWARELLATSAFAPFVRREFTPGPSVSTPDQIRAYIRDWAKTDYHPVGTCKMGIDELAVVDPSLRVHGLAGLRVIDSSIMPTIISGNTQATSVMIGEKGAAAVLGTDAALAATTG